jgi:hypothetical protein
MKPLIRKRIERIFAKRYREAHQFQKGNAGLKEFAQLLPMVRKLSKKELDEILVPLLDRLIFFTEHCQPCNAKALVFAELFCIDKIPDKSVEYLRKYEELMKDRQTINQKFRNFRAEVYEALSKHLERDAYG